MTKISDYRMSKLNNAEHLAFHMEAKAFIEECGATNISAVEELTQYAQAIEGEVAIVNRQTASSITGDLEAKDTERDGLLSYLFASVDNAKNAPMDAFKEAYKQLIPVMSPYRGIASKTNAQESAEITGLLHDLKAEKLANHIASLNLENILTLIEKANGEYMALDQQRTSEVPSKADSKAIRLKTDDVYESIVDKTNATLILMPNDNAKTLAQNLNNHIDKTKASYNRRMA